MSFLERIKWHGQPLAKAERQSPLEGLRILLLGDLASPHIEKWANGIRERGARVAVFSYTPENDCVYHEDVERIYADNQPDNIDHLRVTASQVRKLHRTWQPDIMHAHYLTSYGIVASSTGHPFIVSVWGKDIYRLQERSRPVRNAAIQALNAASVICSTSHTMAHVTRERTRNRIEVVPFGIDTTFFRSQSDDFALPLHHNDTVQPVEPNVPVITVTKWMDDDKYGQSVLIKAVGRLREEGVKVRVVLTGDATDDTPKLIDLAKTLGVDDLLELTGRLDRVGIRDLLARTTVAVFPSLRADDSFSVATIEASAMGVPVIASAIGGLLETVIDGETGEHFPPGDHLALSEKLRGLISDRTKRTEYGRAGRRLVESTYEFRSNLDRMSELYRIY